MDTRLPSFHSEITPFRHYQAGGPKHKQSFSVTKIKKPARLLTQYSPHVVHNFNEGQVFEANDLHKMIIPTNKKEKWKPCPSAAGSHISAMFFLSP